MLVAASDDGILFSSLRLDVWLLPHDGFVGAHDSDDGCESAAGAYLAGLVPPDAAANAKLAAAALFGLAAVVLLCAAAASRRAAAAWRAESDAGNELQKLSSEGENGGSWTPPLDEKGPNAKAD